MWRLRLLLEKVGWRSIAIGGAVVVALVAAVVSLALIRGGGEPSAATTQSTEPESTTNLFYLRALAPKTRIQGCDMWIRFTWRPDYNADQYIDAPALITASGSAIQGTYRKLFRENGVSIELGPVSLASGYQLWSAEVTALDQDPPGNETTITAGPPADNPCD